MKHLLLYIFALLIQSNLHAQKLPDSLFLEASNLYGQEKYFEAAESFKHLFESYTDFDKRNQCMYNTAYSYHQADSLDRAIIWYEKIRSSNLKDSDQVGGKGIFEPYANYKHYSTFYIANIEYNKGNIEKALKYYNASLSEYPYLNSSGTDLRMNKNRIKIYITDCYENLEMYDRALITIIPQVLDSEGSVNYAKVAARALNIIMAHFSKKEIMKELTESLESLEFDKKKNCYKMRFRKTNMLLYPYFLDENTIDNFKLNIRESAFWTILGEE